MVLIARALQNSGKAASAAGTHRRDAFGYVGSLLASDCIQAEGRSGALVQRAIAYTET